jgi:hypothetical protein
LRDRHLPSGAMKERAHRTRIALSIVLAIDLPLLAYFLGEARARAASPSHIASAIAIAPVRWGIAAIGIAAVLAFARRAGRIRPGLVALIALGILSHAHAALFGSPWRHLYVSGLCLLGWLVGLAYDRKNEIYARTGAIALLGASYFSAGASKLVYGGLGWISGLTLRHTMLGQDGLVGDGILAGLRHAVVAHPWAGALLACATIAFELGGALFLVGPRTRALVASGLIAMHLSIFLLTGIAYVESVLLLAVFGFPLAAPEHDAQPDKAVSWRATLAIGGPLLLACAIGMAFQGARSRDLMNAPLPRAQTAPAMQSLGPFHVGDRIEGFDIESLSVAPDSAVLSLRRGARELAFDLTCSGAHGRGPYDDGALHVYYRPTSLPRTELDAVGNTVRQRIHAAAQGHPCPALHDWIE